ncbi:ICE2-domain-containing protein [Aulographum hederae CBS 113979]|uniref:ICE2-domain-containing protein n=1 Tax=Aulographum hederae CBS 113979 TaxID=1176131 RepID=A0A6G1H487_9PEZI|nr:ICE2-domain-containing protein [Aulographum hederae CBS 113979]
MWLTRAISQSVFLFLIVFTIPLAFDVGGRTCGLAFSLSLASFYFFYSTLRLITPNGSRFRYTTVQLVGYTQWFFILFLLIWTLNKFSVDANANGGWVERTFNYKRAGDTTIREWLFGRNGLAESFTIGTWDKILRYSTPVFQIAEGFCSLLVIQAAGQITRYYVNRERGDIWMIALLGVAASIISTSIYFLYRITTFPEISNVDAILIGATITCAVFLGGWGIGSGRGNPVESSLLFAYITLCIYQIFTDYQPSHPAETMSPPSQPALPPLPPIIMASYSTLMHALSTLPSMVHSASSFLVAAVMTITPSVIISLAYRVFVMYASARIIPAVRESGARALSQEPSLDDDDEAGRLLGFLTWFSPSILIAVYTSLLMQHFASTSGDGGPGEWWTSQGGDAGGNFWRWINLAATMGLYTLELYLGRADDENRLTSHWKID